MKRQYMVDETPNAKCPARSAWLKLKESNGEINGEDSEKEAEREKDARKKGTVLTKRQKGIAFRGGLRFAYDGIQNSDKEGELRRHP